MVCQFAKLRGQALFRTTIPLSVAARPDREWSYEINHFCFDVCFDVCFNDGRAPSLSGRDYANAGVMSSCQRSGQGDFTGRCGKCHDADASKKLPDGTTLLARLARNKDPETRLATRLKNEQERHQVFLYLQPLIERERLSGMRQGSVESRLK
jgi:hypothetical protein